MPGQGLVTITKYGSDPDPFQSATAKLATWIRGLTIQHQAFLARMDERRRLTVSSQHPDWTDLGKAFAASRTPGRDAILQPPKPQITPMAPILQLAAGHDTEPEAAN
jgi:hypothetical protein